MTFQELEKELKNFCKKEDIPEYCVYDLVQWDKLTKAQKEWVQNWITKYESISQT